MSVSARRRRWWEQAEPRRRRPPVNARTVAGAIAAGLIATALAFAILVAIASILRRAPNNALQTRVNALDDALQTRVNAQEVLP